MDMQDLTPVAAAAANNVDTSVATIATSAVQIRLQQTTWGAKKTDQAETDKVIADTGAKTKEAARVMVSLMAGDKDFDAISSYITATRVWLKTTTLPWYDGGWRLLPAPSILPTVAELDKRIAEFNGMVAAFAAGFDTKISAQLFAMGSLSKRSDYPTSQQVARAFSMSYTMLPIPTAGDFRVDVQAGAADYLREQFRRDADIRIAAALAEPWARIQRRLTHAKARIDALIDFEERATAAMQAQSTEKLRRPNFHESALTQVLELCDIMDTLNVTNDPQMAECAAETRRLFSGLDAKSLKASPEVARSASAKVSAILDKFNLGGLNEDGEE